LRCGKKGHWASDCRIKKEEPAHQAHVAQEEEATLMLAIDVAQEEDSSPPPQPPHFTKSPPPPPVALPELHVLEKKVHPELDDAADRDPTR
jgi:hypothetical protein